MANKIKGINIKIGADTTGLDTALKKIETSNRGTKSELGEINRSLKSNKDSVILWSQKQEVLTQAIANSKEKTKALELAQKGMEQAFRDGNIDRQAYDNFKEKLQKASDKLKDLKNQQTDFEQKFQSGEIDKDAYDKFIDKVKRAEHEVQGLENSQRSMEENVRLGTVSAEQYRDFQREVVRSERDTQSFENQLNEANQELQRLGNQAEDTAEDVGNSANGGYTVLGNVFANVITRGIEIAGTALKNFAQDVVTTGMEYEAAISNVTAISGAMSEEVELLQAKAEEMGATTKFTATESAEAMGYMAMAGWKVNDMVSGLDGIMDLSAASGESLASVSDIVTDALTAFGLTAGDSAHFADVLAAASSNANTNVAMMGETFKYAAPIAGALGFSIEDTAEAIGLMANSGIKASQAGTSLRTIMTNLSHEMTIYGEAFKSATNAEGAYTVATTNADGTMRDFGDILADLRTGWEQLTEAEQASNAAMETVAGKHAMSGFLALMNAAPADVEKLSTAIENADGAAQDMASTMLDNLQGDKTLLESAVDGMKIAISKELNPALRDVTQWATKQIPKVQTVIEPMFKTAINGVKSLTDGLEKIKPVLSAVKPLIAVVFADKAISLFTKTLMPKAISLLGKIPTLLIKPIDLLGKLPLMIDSLPAKISKIPTALAGVGNSFKALWSVIAANPLAATGIALTGVALAVKDHIDNIEIEKTELEKLIEKNNEELQLLADKRQAIRDLDDAFYENVDGIQNQTDRTKDLWKELDKLADKSGNVQQKDKERAEYLLGELNEALGTEYTMTGNQIENYKNLSAEIDNVIAKKQAEMMLDAYLANSTEMTKQRIEARTDYENADKDYQEKKKIVEDAEKDYKKVTGRSASEIQNGMSEDDVKAIAQTTEEYVNGYALLLARENLQAADNARTQAKRNYEATSEYFEKMDDLQEAYSLGQYNRMADIIYREQELTSTTLDESATDAEQRFKIYSENLEKTLSLFELNSRKMSQTAVDELGKELEITMQSAALTDEDKNKVWEENFKEYFDKYLEEGFDVSPMIAFADELEMSPVDIAGEKWREVIQKQRKNGHDITDFLKLAINNDYKPEITFKGAENFNEYLWERLTNGQDIEYLLDWGFSKGNPDIINSDEFQDAYRETVQEHLEKGLDIDNLLKWYDKTNLSDSAEFVDIFRKTVEEKLENGETVGSILEWGNKLGIDMGDIFGERFGEQMETLNANATDMTEFIKWAESKGKKVGEIFGENFQQLLEEYLTIPAEEIKIYDNSDDVLTKNLISYYKNGKDISALARLAREKGLKIDTVFGEDFMNVFQKQLDGEHDIQELVKWAAESGAEVSEEYSDVYTEIVQDCIDKGYDIENLLQWGKDSGLSTGDTFGSSYTPEAQTFIDKGFAVDSLLEWARKAAIDAGILFGENFQEYVNRYIGDKREEAEHVIENSGNVVSGHLSNILGKLPFMANGGFLRNGQAVVAEAGPELLEIVNGGVRVTPLSENSRNIATNQGQKIFYSNYTINATISNGYDVSRLAEDLETERRRIERGIGK